MEETREQRIERLCGAMERALVERREVQPKRAAMYVQRVMGKGGIQDQEMELMFLALDFRLHDVIAE